jgi:hypothetical protein
MDCFDFEEKLELRDETGVEDGAFLAQPGFSGRGDLARWKSIAAGETGVCGRWLPTAISRMVLAASSSELCLFPTVVAMFERVGISWEFWDTAWTELGSRSPGVPT